MKNIIVLLFLMLCVIVAQSQEEYFSVKGRILSYDSLQPIYNTNIISELSHYGTISDKEGFFTIKSKKIDTLWVSCIGYVINRIPVCHDSISNKVLIIKLIRKTEVLDEVDIYPYPDYETFKRNIINMPWRKPFFVPGISKESDEKQIYKKPVKEPPASIINPISLIYNRFNKKAVFKRKLNRNRRRFNKEMERIGADSLMIPENLDF